jgi:hypothetical protein
MSDDPAEPPPRKPIPTLIWVMLAVVVVLGFVVLLRLFNPPGIGRTPPTSDVVVAPGGSEP